MGASKRSNYSANTSRNAGAEAARNLGVVLGLGGLSFFLGFFVLSRMVPDKHDEAGLAPAAVAHDISAASTRTPVPASAPDRNETVASASAAPNRDDKGPIVERETEPTTQTPGSVERASKPAAPDASNSADPGDTAAATGANPAAGADSTANTDSTTGANPAAGRTDSTTPRQGRHNRTDASDAASASSDKNDTGGFSQEDQKPSHIDRDSSGDAPTRATRHEDSGSSASRSESADSATDEPSRSAKTVKRVRYSVRGSAYSRREAAEREVRKITDLGLEAAVVPVTTEDGTTVYRVQQGVYRNRSNAEKAKTKLSDAGVEAEIVKTSGA